MNGVQHRCPSASRLSCIPTRTYWLYIEWSSGRALSLSRSPGSTRMVKSSPSISELLVHASCHSRKDLRVAAGQLHIYTIVVVWRLHTGTHNEWCTTLPGELSNSRDLQLRSRRHSDSSSAYSEALIELWGESTFTQVLLVKRMLIQRCLNESSDYFYVWLRNQLEHVCMKSPILSLASMNGVQEEEISIFQKTYLI